MLQKDDRAARGAEAGVLAPKFHTHDASATEVIPVCGELTAFQLDSKQTAAGLIA